jgi:ABC-type transport system substrate-binding protein
VTGRNARTAAAGLSLLLALATAGRGALGPVYGGRLVVELGALPARFDPAPARGAGSRLIAALVHEELVDLGHGAPRPSLAESWTESSGGREIVIHLRAGAAFHDGTPIGSADVARSLRRFLRSPSAAAGHLAARVEGGAAYRRRATERLPGVAASGPLAVVLRLRQPSASALATLAAADAAITSARGAGAGPFVPTTASPIRGRAAFVPFPGHVRGRPFLDGITVHAASAAGDDAGRADVVPAIGPGPRAASLLLVLDPGHPAFARLEQRRAVGAAIDADDLVRNFLPGGATTASAIPALLLPALPPAGAKHRARRLTGGVTLAVSSDVPALVSQRVVASLGAAGLLATAVAADPDAAWTIPAAARLVAWTPEVPDALLALEELAGLVRGEGRDLLARAAIEADAERRLAMIHRAEAALRARVVVVPLAALSLGFRSPPGRHGIASDQGGRLRLENAWVAP